MAAERPDPSVSAAGFHAMPAGPDWRAGGDVRDAVVTRQRLADRGACPNEWLQQTLRAASRKMGRIREGSRWLIWLSSCALMVCRYGRYVVQVQAPVMSRYGSDATASGCCRAARAVITFSRGALSSPVSFCDPGVGATDDCYGNAQSSVWGVAC
jgi:hypothetical protein